MSKPKRGYVYLTEVHPGDVRPCVCLSDVPQYPFMLPLAKFDSARNTLSELYVRFTGNKDAFSVGCIDQAKSIEPEKVGRNLGLCDGDDFREIIELLEFNADDGGVAIYDKVTFD